MLARVKALGLPLLGSLVWPLLFGTACFEIDPRPPPPGPGGTITGTILVTDATGFATGRDADAVRQARVDVALADTNAATGTGSSDVVVTGRPNAPVVPARPTSKVPLEWKAGDVLVLFEDKAFDEATLRPVVTEMLGHAGLSDVNAEVARCTARRYCTVRLYTGDGELLDMDATARAAELLQKHRAPRVKVVARNMKKYGLRTPNDPNLAFQWHYDFIHMSAAWDIETGDPDLVIAIVDSGIVSAHPDLNARLARDPQNNTIVGADLISEAGVDGDAFAGRDTDPEDPGDQAFDGTSSFHGTHIAGTIGAETDNGEGVAGITFAGQLLPVRVLGLGLQGFDDDIMDGIYWAIGDPDVPGVPDNVKPARIVNLSLGGASDAASQEFWEQNFANIFSDPTNIYNDPIFVAAAGNTDEEAGTIVPANLPGMIAVGASNIAGLRASYSNYGSIIDVMAPGGDGDINGNTDLNSDGQPDQVLSTVGGGDFNYREGTSMAAPHVTGVIALLVSANPALGQAEVETIIKQSADARGQCNEGCGAGWLDAVGALLLAGGEIQLEPLLAADNSQLFIPQGFQSATVRVLNLGNAPLSFGVAIEGPQADLFAVTPTSGTLTEASNGIEAASAELTVTLLRQGFEAGNANLRIVTTDVDPPQEIFVDLTFNDDATRRPRELETVEVGAFQIEADGTAGERVASALATRATGFTYEMKDVPAGQYLIFAVGDDNLDGRFTAEIESFGGYPTAEDASPVPVQDEQVVTGIDIRIEAAFITDIVGGVGAPCNDDNDCTFANDAVCINNFEGGYCTRICDDGDCDANGSCEQMTCGADDCNVCLVRCVSDTQCRFAENYVCDLGSCVPEDLRISQ